MKWLCRLAAVIGAALAVAGPTRAATVYTNEAAFQAALGASQTFLNEFSDLPAFTQFVHPLSYESNGLAYAVSSEPGFNLFSLEGAISTIGWDNRLVVTFTNGHVRAAGGWCYLTDNNGARATGSLTMMLSDGTTVVVASPTNVPPPFMGFVWSGSVTAWLKIQSGTTNRFPVLDHFYVSESRPSLSIAGSLGGMMRLSWPAPATGYGLQWNSQVGGAGWMGVGVLPQLVGDRWQVVLPVAEGRRYYRLKRQ